MKIALVDDNVIFLNKFESLLTKRLSYFNILNFTIHLFPNFQEYLASSIDYNVLFIDVEINTDNGIELCKEIREYNSKIDIIFVSSYSQYVFNSFSINPFSYILKEKIETDGVNEVDRYIQYYIDKNSTIMIESFGIKYKLYQKAIKVISKRNNKCIFYYGDHSFEARTTLKEILPELSPYFAQINKSEIVNFYFVSDIFKDEIVMNDNIIYYISRRRVEEVTEKWLLHLKNGG